MSFSNIYSDQVRYLTKKIFLEKCCGVFCYEESNFYSGKLKKENKKKTLGLINHASFVNVRNINFILFKAN